MWKKPLYFISWIYLFAITIILDIPLSRAIIINNYPLPITSTGIVVYTQPSFSNLITQQYVHQYSQDHNLTTSLSTSSTSIIPPRPARQLYDVFCYNGEISLLLWRLKHLGSIVSTFIIIEGDHTHQGNPKASKLTPSIKEQIASTGANVVYITAALVARQDNFSVDDRWQLAKENELRQRDAGTSYILANSQDDDMVIIGDVDELPDPEYLKKWHTFPSIGKVRAKMFYYSFECLHVYYWYSQAIASVHAIKQVMHKSKAGRLVYNIGLTRGILVSPNYKSLTGLSESDVPLNMIRFMLRLVIPLHYLGSSDKNDVGWHCSYCMSPADMQNKLRSFSHIEYSGDAYTSLSHIYKAVSNCYSLFSNGDDGTFIRRPVGVDIPPLADTIEQTTSANVQEYIKKLNLSVSV